MSEPSREQASPDKPQHTVKASGPCGCIVKQSPSRLWIEYCPLHAQAPAMRTLIERAMAAEDPDEWMADAVKLLAAIEGPPHA